VGRLPAHGLQLRWASGLLKQPNHGRHGLLALAEKGEAGQRGGAAVARGGSGHRPSVIQTEGKRNGARAVLGKKKWGGGRLGGAVWRER
jgi:hypothetical protein